MKYSDTANAIAVRCCKAMVPALLALTAVASAGCDNDWQTWWVGSRTQWNVTKDFYMGLDVLYSKLQSSQRQRGFYPTRQRCDWPASAGTVGGQLHVDDQDNWSFRFRVHRDFYP